MKRRHFLRMLLYGGIFLVFRRHSYAANQDEKTLRKAMFWKKTG